MSTVVKINTDANPAYITIPDSGGSSVQAGVATALSGTLVVAVVLATPIVGSAYSIGLTPGFAGASGGTPPTVWWSDKTDNGFNINLQGDPGFDINIAWSAAPDTQ